MLTADHVARAIVAACRETGDDPIRTAIGELGTQRPTNRARHYAMHALLHVFPDLLRFTAARLVGCPGSEKQFWNSSWHQIVKPRASGLGHVANWFDDEAFGRIIDAIGLKPESDPLSHVEIEEEEKVEPPPFRVPVPCPAPGRPPYRPLPDTAAKTLEDDDDGDDRPVFDKGHIAVQRQAGPPVRPSKRAMYDDLRAAVVNTQKLTPPPDGE